MRSKDEVQVEIINKIVDNDFRGIVLSSVRSGKTRILLTSVLKHMVKVDPNVVFKDKSVLILYPNIDIKNSWIDECKKVSCPTKLTFCTFASMRKIVDMHFDYILIDEAHLLGEENQLPIVAELVRKNKFVILASGTYSGSTLSAIRGATKLNLIVDYSTEAAIQDGIVCDYKVIIHKYTLDNTVKREFGTKKKWQSTDAAEAVRLTTRVNNSEGQSKMFSAIQRMAFINSNHSLINVVNKWITEHSEDRFLLFAGSEKIGLNYNIPMFNNKSKTTENLDNFIAEKINKLCLIKKGSAGVTYPNLSKIVITAVNSNGENLEQMVGRALLTDTEDAEVHIFVSDQSFQTNWLNTALCRVNKDKISYLYEQ
jgi:superfamily II DNA or RNA helicase